MPKTAELAVADDAGARWARRKEARPAEILDAALALFSERGFAGTKVEDIAKRAGVTAGTIYRYFPSKEDMLKAGIVESLVEGIARGEAEMDHCDQDPRGRLRFMLRSWWDYVGNARSCAIARLMMSEAVNFPDLADYYRQAVIERAQHLVRGVLADGIAGGWFRPQPLDVAVQVVVAPLVMGMLWKATPNLCGLQNLDFDRFVDEVIETLMRGLCTAEPPAHRRPHLDSLTVSPLPATPL